jgi:hypothetical protein
MGMSEGGTVSEMKMANRKRASDGEANVAAITAEKRVILSMGGKGGVGKTSVMAGLAEWFAANEIPVKLLDLDTENKARGSLTHFFGGSVPKVNIHTPAGLDSFVDQLSGGPPVILADMERAQAKSPTTGSRRCIPTCPMPESCSPPSVSSRRTRPAWKVFSPGRRVFRIGSSI